MNSTRYLSFWKNTKTYYMQPILYKEFDSLDTLKSYLISQLPITTKNELLEVIQQVIVHMNKGSSNAN